MTRKHLPFPYQKWVAHRPSTPTPIPGPVAAKIPGLSYPDWVEHERKRDRLEYLSYVEQLVITQHEPCLLTTKDRAELAQLRKMFSLS